MPASSRHEPGVAGPLLRQEDTDWLDKSLAVRFERASRDEARRDEQGPLAEATVGGPRLPHDDGELT